MREDDQSWCDRLTPYRLYFLGGDGRIVRGLDLGCVSDAAAIRTVGFDEHTHAMALWRGAERVVVELTHQQVRRARLPISILYWNVRFPQARTRPRN